MSSIANKARIIQSSLDSLLLFLPSQVCEPPCDCRNNNSATDATTRDVTASLLLDFTDIHAESLKLG